MDKHAIRETVWDAFDADGIARFPFPPHGRIPNFAGADDASTRLTETREWDAADVVKCNPDAPQLPVRRAALRAGKTVYVAQPRLRDPNPFLRLDPAAIDDVDAATTVSGIGEYGQPVAPDAVSHVDLVVSGSVAVTTAGIRIGKGEGYSDLEWGMLCEFAAVDKTTTVATTVHEAAILDGPASPLGTGDSTDTVASGALTPEPHDVPIDVIVTPERTIRTATTYSRPTGVEWDRLDAERLAEMPVLQRLAPADE